MADRLMTSPANGQQRNIDVVIDILTTRIEALSSNADTRFNTILQQMQSTHDDLVRVPTTVDRSSKDLRELLESKLSGDFGSVSARLNGMYDIIDLLKTRIEIRSSESVAEVKHLRDVMNENVKRIETMIAERDSRADQRAGDVKSAVDTAFQNAKEAITEIKASFTKLIDSMGLTINDKTQNLDRLISDLKDRLTSIESRSGATDPQVNSALTILTSKVDGLGTIGSLSGGRLEGASSRDAEYRSNMALVISAIVAIAGIGMMFLRVTGHTP